MEDNSGLVSTEWLAKHLSAPDVRVVDATYYLPGDRRDAKAEFASEHIPGAVFFDIDDIADESADLPHMLPDPVKFSSRVRKLGLGDGNRIVVYDRQGMFSAPRVWWTFRAFGHKDVAVLDGGLPKWKAEGRPLDDHPGLPRERHFTARLNDLTVRDRTQMQRNLTNGRELVLDARSAERFRGEGDEPRPGLRSGHIPGSRSLPYSGLFDPDNGTLLPRDQLKAKLTEAGVDYGKPVVTTCGSGVTAAILSLALELTGHRDHALYDGSWADWGRPGDTPIATGSE